MSTAEMGRSRGDRWRLPFVIPGLFRRSKAETAVEQRAAQPGKTPELDKDLIELWSNLPRTIVSYEPGVLSDSTPYPGGRMLVIGKEQVMDTFEMPWVVKTADEMWGGRKSRQDIAERGFGLGLLAEENHKRMRMTGGKHVVIELNKQVYGDAATWAMEKLQQATGEGREMSVTLKFKNKEGKEREHTMRNPQQADQQAVIDPEKKSIEIVLIQGDADEEILKYPSRSFSLIFSDTHQLRPEHMGIHDLLDLNQLKLLLKQGGKFTFCAFHRRNQGADMDRQQRVIILKDFRRYDVTTADVLVHENSEYLEAGWKPLPIVTCYEPLFEPEARQQELFVGGK